MRIRRLAALIIPAVCLLAPAARANDADVILDMLVQKGLLTSEEARQVRDEIAKKSAKEAAPDAKGAGAITWGGDLRLRHDALWHARDLADRPAGSTSTTIHDPDRHRERIRMRLGMKARISSALDAGVRIATGSPLNPISTNQTLGEIFDKKPLFVDQAYLRLTGPPRRVPFTILAGKFDVPFVSTPLVWDTDVTLEGAAGSLAPTVGPVEVTMTGGAFPVREIASTEADPALFAGQVALGWSPVPQSAQPSMKALELKIAAAYYDFTHLKSGIDALNGAGLGNTVDTTKKAANVLYLAREFKDFDVNVEIATTLAGRPGRLFGDFVRNTSGGGDDQGYLAGVRWGRTDSPGAWEAGYSYEHLEADAVLAQFADSDFGDGGTNNQGHAFWLTIGTLKNSTLSARYCAVNSIKSAGGFDRRTKLLQMDWVTKF